eukprot:8339084-Pyramimonas_sp.AAC.1
MACEATPRQCDSDSGCWKRAWNQMAVSAYLKELQLLSDRLFPMPPRVSCAQQATSVIRDV